MYQKKQPHYELPICDMYRYDMFEMGHGGRSFDISMKMAVNRDECFMKL